MKKEYVEFLKNNYGRVDLTLEEMAKHLGLTPKTTAAYGQRLGLKRNSIFPLKDDEIFRSMEKIGFTQYEVSNYGTVRNSDGVLIRSHPHHQSNYLQIRLMSDTGKRESALVHRLVAETFLGTQDDIKLQVDHIDGNRVNNYVENLQFITASENVSKTKERAKVKRYLTEAEVRDICVKLEEGMSISEICETNDFYTKSKVEKIKQRARWIKISKEYKF